MSTGSTKNPVVRNTKTITTPSTLNTWSDHAHHLGESTFNTVPVLTVVETDCLAYNFYINHVSSDVPACSNLPYHQRVSYFFNLILIYLNNFNGPNLIIFGGAQ